MRTRSSAEAGDTRPLRPSHPFSEVAGDLVRIVQRSTSTKSEGRQSWRRKPEGQSGRTTVDAPSSAPGVQGPMRERHPDVTGSPSVADSDVKHTDQMRMPPRGFGHVSHRRKQAGHGDGPAVSVPRSRGCDTRNRPAGRGPYQRKTYRPASAAVEDAAPALPTGWTAMCAWKTAWTSSDTRASDRRKGQATTAADQGVAPDDRLGVTPDDAIAAQPMPLTRTVRGVTVGRGNTR